MKSVGTSLEDTLLLISTFSNAINTSSCVYATRFARCRGRQNLTDFLHKAWSLSLGADGSEKRRKAMALAPSSGRVSHKMISKQWRPSTAYIKKELEMPEVRESKS